VTDLLWFYWNWW